MCRFSSIRQKAISKNGCKLILIIINLTNIKKDYFDKSEHKKGEEIANEILKSYPGHAGMY